MKELLRFAWDVLLFRHEAYARHVARADVLKRGLLLLVVVTLFAGSISFLVSFVRDLRPVDPMQQMEEVEQEFRDALRQIAPFWDMFDLPAGFEEELLRYVRPNMEMGFRIAALPTPLPGVIGRVLTDLGAFLSLPFTRLTGWIGYTIWVLLIAKLLGGKGTVAQVLGATSLYAIPQALSILDFVPCLGPVLGIVAAVWGAAIYIKALDAANKFGIGKAIVAAVVPALVQAILILTGVFAAIIAAFASG